MDFVIQWSCYCWRSWGNRLLPGWSSLCRSTPAIDEVLRRRPVQPRQARSDGTCTGGWRAWRSTRDGADVDADGPLNIKCWYRSGPSAKSKPPTAKTAVKSRAPRGRGVADGGEVAAESAARRSQLPEAWQASPVASEPASAWFPYAPYSPGSARWCRWQRLAGEGPLGRRLYYTPKIRRATFCRPGLVPGQRSAAQFFT